MRQKQTDSSALPTTGAILATGFDLTTKHIWLLIVPILLDLFYWLGPRLSFTQLFQTFIQVQLVEIQNDPRFASIGSQLATDIPATNLFSSLSLPLVGVPSFMAGLPESTPLVPNIVEIQSWTSWLSYLIVLVVIGLLITTVYFALVGRVVATHLASGVVTRSGETAVLPLELESGSTFDMADLLKRIRHSWPRLFVVLFTLFIFLLMLYIPAAIVGSIISLFVGATGLVLTLLIVPFIGIWVVVYLSFVPHGLVQNGRSLRRAVVESGLMVHRQFYATLSFLLAIWIINTFVDMILLLADDGSWFAIIIIFGHAFISTAMVMATFIFYQTRYTKLYQEIY